MATIDVNDATLHDERSGHGPALLFVYGMCGDADVWADQARRLGGRSTCVRDDRRGHTRSARGEATPSPTLHAADAAALIATLPFAPCLVVGSQRRGDRRRRRAPPWRSGVRCRAQRTTAVQPRPRRRRRLHRRADPAHRGGDRTRRPAAAIDAVLSFVCPGLWSTLDGAGKEGWLDNADIRLADLRSPPLTVTPAELSTITVPALVIAGSTSHPARRRTFTAT